MFPSNLVARYDYVQIKAYFKTLLSQRVIRLCFQFFTNIRNPFVFIVL